MRVAIRTDASRRIGTGHVMRCLTLAQALREGGADVLFLSRELDGHLCDRVEQAGFAVARLRTPAKARSAGNRTAHAHWLELDWRDDASECLAALGGRGPADWLVVDHYALDARWHEALAPAAPRVLVLDDLADRPHACDLLLDPSLPASAERYAARVPEGCGLLLGPDYALLRDEFIEARAKVRARSGAVRRVFVSFGGIDAGNHTGKAVEAIRQLGLKADVLAGRSNIAELMAAADLGVGAGGVMAWERIAVGLPSLAVVVAANQAHSVAGLAQAGCVEPCAPDELHQRLAALVARPERLHEMSARCLALLDGRGARRVARAMAAPRVELRDAVLADRDPMFAWRNDADVRRYFMDPSPVPREAHERWFAAVLADPNRHLMIAQAHGHAVGVLRYDVAGASAKVSIYLVPGHDGHGFGPAILRAGAQWLRAHRAEVATVQAEVHADNRNSQRAFLEAGYRPQQGGFRQVLR